MDMTLRCHSNVAWLEGPPFSLMYSDWCEVESGPEHTQCQRALLVCKRAALLVWW